MIVRNEVTRAPRASTLTQFLSKRIKITLKFGKYEIHNFRELKYDFQQHAHTPVAGRHALYVRVGRIIFDVDALVYYGGAIQVRRHKVGLPLRPAAWLCPDNGDTGQKTKTRLRAMTHMHMESCTGKACARSPRAGEIVTTDHGPSTPPLPFAICKGGEPPSHTPTPPGGETAVLVVAVE